MTLNKIIKWWKHGLINDNEARKMIIKVKEDK